MIKFSNLMIDLSKLPYKPIRVEFIHVNEANTIAAVCYLYEIKRS